MSPEQFKTCYSVVNQPVLLVDPDGRVLALNSAAAREFAVTNVPEAEPIHLETLFSDDEAMIHQYLCLCARTKNPVPGRFIGSTPKATQYSARGQLLCPASNGQSPQLILVLQAKEKVIEEFLVLNEKINALGREVKRRQDLESERSSLLERERAAKVEVQQLFVQAQEASRAKSLFLAQMSHEIRTPLNAILGFSDLLIESGQVTGENYDFLGRIVVNGQRLLRIIDDILDLSKFEAGKIPVENIKFSVMELVNDVVHSLRPLAEGKNIQLPLSFKTAIPQVIQSDPARLRQILLNLIGNAIKFTHSGHVETRLSFQNAARDHVSQMLVIDIADTGIGISAEQQARLFQAFEQGDTSTNRRFGGAGLGLAISQKFAAALGGDIELASSVEGFGSCFRLRVPTGDVSETLFVSQNQNAYQAPEKSLRAVAEREKRLKGRKILLAEDSPDGAALVSLYLQAEGAEVSLAQDGFEVIKASERDMFDIILMDIQMPGMDGLEATRHLRSKGYSRPILALTAHALREEVERSLRAGCDAHLTKPVKKSDLISEIHTALANSHPRTKMES